MRGLGRSRHSRRCVVLAALAVLCVSGCTKTLRVTNLTEYAVSPTSGPRLDVALTPSRASGDLAIYHRDIVEALRAHPHVANVRTDWASDRHEDGFNPSHLVDVQVTPKYDGSPGNFLVTFPGFLVFACAWHGYIYYADVKTQLRAAQLPDAKSVLDSKKFDEAKAGEASARFRMTHCSFKRGFWSGTGWWFPGWGIHNIVTGVIFTGYDKEATQPFHQAADRPYGDYVAQQVVALLAELGAVQYAQTTPRRRVGPGVTVRPLPRIHWDPSKGRVWILSVGVGEYKSSEIPALKYARSDALRVRKWFASTTGGNVPGENCRVLLDQQATRENFLSEVDWLSKRALPEDLVVVYFAGHGAPEIDKDGRGIEAKYLLFHESDPDKMFATALQFEQLKVALDRVKSQQQLVILESCYGGPVGKRALGKTPTEDIEIKHDELKGQIGSRRGRLLLSASTGRQVALCPDEVKREKVEKVEGGLFTHYLLDALGDGSKPIRKEVFPAAKDGVRRAALALGSTQEPQLYGDQNMEVVLRK